MPVTIRGNQYETVAERKQKFYQMFENGLIYPELLNPQEISESALFKVRIWKEKPNSINDVPDGIGYAYENSTMGQASKTNWLENCETSAIGRALSNMGLGNGSCSAEEIQTAMNREKKLKSQSPKSDRKAQRRFFAVAKEVGFANGTLAEALALNLRERFKVESRADMTPEQWVKATTSLEDPDYRKNIKRNAEKREAEAEEKEEENGSAKVDPPF